MFLCAFIAFVMPSKLANADIILNKVSDIFFGQLDYDTASHNGIVRLGTNSQVSTTGSGLVHDGFGTAGRVIIFSNTFDVVEVRCDTSGTIALSSNTLAISNTEAVLITPQPFGSAPDCAGVSGTDAPIGVLDTRVNNLSSVFVGGELTIPSNSLVSGEYSSSNAGGAAITINVVVQ